MNNPLLKTFSLKVENEEAGNSFTGIANALGIMDRGGDVIAPGAFKKATKTFLTEGFIPTGHDWRSMPVAMPTKAKEAKGADGMTNLEIEGEWHSTERAQEAKTVVSERMAKGLMCGLSVGFSADWESCMYFETGKAMWDHIMENEDPRGYDEKSIKAQKRWCCLIKDIPNLYEVSVVTVPMNQGSSITGTKSMAELHAEELGENPESQNKIYQLPTAFLDANPDAAEAFAKWKATNNDLDQGLTLEQETEKVLTTNEEYAGRLLSIRDIRTNQGKTAWSEAHIAKAQAVIDSLSKLLPSAPDAEEIPSTDDLRKQFDALTLPQEVYTSA